MEDPGCPGTADDTTAPATAPGSGPQAAPGHCDLTDLPADVLGRIFSQLPPGHRLNLRSVNRGWATWLDGCLIPATHLNLVMDLRELQHAIQSAVRRRRSSCSSTFRRGAAAAAAAADGCGGCSGASVYGDSNNDGLLGIRFPTASAVRLWVGCRPPATLAGLNGGGTAATLYDSLLRQRSAAAAGATPATDLTTYRRAAQVLREATASALQSATTSLAVASASVSETVQLLRAQLANAAYSCLFAGLRLLVRRHPPLRPQRRRAEPAGPRWHVHQRKHGTAAVQGLRRYAPEPPEAVLQPLSACLPLLGGSHRLTRLSLVTAFDVSAEDLQLLVAAFPNLTALALHAYQGLFLDFNPVELPSLGPLLLPPAAEPPQALGCDTDAASGAQPPLGAASDAAAAAATATSATAAASASRAIGAPSTATSAAGVVGDPSQGRARFAGTSGSGSDASGGDNHLGGDDCSRHTSGALAELRLGLALVSRLVQVPALAPPAPVPPPPLPPLLRLRSLELCSLRGGWPEAGGLQHLTALRSLALHRTVCRMHRVMPQIKALTQLTRLELRRLDYHHALPMDAEDERQLAWKIQRRMERDKRRRQQQAVLQQLQPGMEIPGSNPIAGGRATGVVGGGAEAYEGDSSDEEDEEEALGLETAPWFMETRGAVRRVVPDWRRTIRSIARAVRGMRDLRVLVCDVECPAEGEPGAWASMETGLTHLPGLMELRLPYMAITDPARLAAALPELGSLELGSLPLRNPMLPISLRSPAGPSTAATAGGAGAGAGAGYGSVAAVGTSRWQVSSQQGGNAQGHDAFADVQAIARHYMARHHMPELRGLLMAAAREASGVGSSAVSSGGGAGRNHAGDLNDTASGTAGSGGSADGARGEATEAYGTRGVGGDGDHGGLSCFAQLRELALHRVGVLEMATEWLPLPPRLQRMEMPLQRSFGQEKGVPLDLQTLALLHCALLPALARVPWVGLTLGPVGPSVQQLLVAMLSYWLPRQLASLDLTVLTHPSSASEEDAAACFRMVASGLPRLRRLTCCLWAGRRGFMDPEVAETRGAARCGSGAELDERDGLDEQPAAAQQPRRGRTDTLAGGVASGGGRGADGSDACGPDGCGGGGGADGDGRGGGAQRCGEEGGSGTCRCQGCSLGLSGSGCGGCGGPGRGRTSAAPPCGAAVAGGRGGGGGGGGGCEEARRGRPHPLEWTAVECLNALEELETLRVKVLTRREPSGRCFRYQGTRVPLGLLRALKRPLRVVDCAPLDAWCCGDGSAHPRQALNEARALLAAEGCGCLLVSETEEWSAGAMGLGQDLEAGWRQEGLGRCWVGS